MLHEAAGVVGFGVLEDGAETGADAAFGGAVAGAGVEVGEKGEEGGDYVGEGGLGFYGGGGVSKIEGRGGGKAGGMGKKGRRGRRKRVRKGKGGRGKGEREREKMGEGGKGEGKEGKKRLTLFGPTTLRRVVRKSADSLQRELDWMAVHSHFVEPLLQSSLFLLVTILFLLLVFRPKLRGYDFDRNDHDGKHSATEEHFQDFLPV